MFVRHCWIISAQVAHRLSERAGRQVRCTVSAETDGRLWRWLWHGHSESRRKRRAVVREDFNAWVFLAKRSVPNQEDGSWARLRR